MTRLFAANGILEVISIAALLSFATLTVAVGSLRAVVTARQAKLSAQSSTEAAFQPATLRWQHALLFPVVGSVMLATLYLAFSYVQHFLIIYITCASAAAVAFTCMPVFGRAPVRREGSEEADRSVSETRSGKPASSCSVIPWARMSGSALFAAAVVTAWAWVGGPLLTNAVGTAMCITMLSLIRIPSLRVATLLLFALLLYDAYWVFLSHKHFGDNVMVHVATQEAANPVHTAAAAVAAAAIPGGEQAVAALLPVTRLSPPNKLEFPVLQWRPHAAATDGAGGTTTDSAVAGNADLSNGSPGGSWVVAWMMLGLGDIALPGMLAALAHAVDDAVRREGEGERESDEGPLSTSISAQQHPRISMMGAGASLPHSALSLAPIGSSATTAARSGCRSVVMRLLCRVTAVRRLRKELWDRPGPSLFRTCLLGYAAGLIVTFIAGRWMRAAQPALVYIVPCTVIPVWLHARRIGGRTLSLLWAGLPEPASAPAAEVATQPAPDHHDEDRDRDPTIMPVDFQSEGSNTAATAVPRPGRRVEV